MSILRNDRQQTAFASPYRNRWLKASILLLVLGLPLAQGLKSDAQESSAQSSATSPENQELRRKIERRYEVLPVHGGVVLTPRAARRGVRAIEVSGDTIAVNGERVNARILGDWLGEDSELILSLLNLDPGTRRALFDLSAEALPPAVAEETATPAPDLDEDLEVPEAPEAPEPPEVPEQPERSDEPSIHSGSRVKFGGSIVVDKDELAEEAVAIGGSVRVDGEVSRDAVAIGGPARINGRVGGNVVSVGGSVHLGPGAVIEGDVTSVGGTIKRAEGAQIHGETAEVGMSPWSGPWRDDWDFDPDFGPFFLFGASMEVFGSMVWMVSLALLTCLVLLLARRSVDRVDRHLMAEPWKCAGVGLAAAFAFFPLLGVITILLVITVIGCALLLLYPFLFLALGLVLLLGYAAVAYRVGRWLERRFGRSFGGPYVAALLGVFMIQIWSVLGQLLALGSGILDLFAFMFILFACVVQAAAWVMGFGGVLLARFGAPPPPPLAASVPPPPAPYGGEPGLPLSEQSWEEPPPG
ncbi:MAG TPA: hypothetical protein VE078_18520 [Thermoanaerobaculia bacterium]|nr:hypothetical protein [Thermoanaerobaculia bacterium]